MRNSSIDRAACRPSAMAQTIRLWPRVMSPAVKTLATLVRLSASALTLPMRVELDAELLEHALPLGTDKSHRQQDEVGGIDLLGTGNLDELRPAVLGLHLDLDRLERT